MHVVFVISTLFLFFTSSSPPPIFWTLKCFPEIVHVTTTSVLCLVQPSPCFDSLSRCLARGLTTVMECKAWMRLLIWIRGLMFKTQGDCGVFFFVLWVVMHTRRLILMCDSLILDYPLCFNLFLFCSAQRKIPERVSSRDLPILLHFQM